MAWLPSLYKARGVPLKQPVCAICVDRTRGATQAVHLTHGVSVYLCSGHASEEFRRRNAGRDFVLTLMRLWQAHGCLTAPRHRALDAHLVALRQGTEKRAGTRPWPGSYAWAALRAEAEALFSRGAEPRRTIAELRGRHARGPAQPPATRTMQRWHAEQRWLLRPRAP